MEDAHYFGQGRLIMTSYKNFDDTKSMEPVKSTKPDKKEKDNKNEGLLYKLFNSPLYNRSVLRYKS
jgi:hypothetical protein